MKSVLTISEIPNVTPNVRFMFNYLHGDIAKQASATNAGDVGARFDAFAMRTQVAF